MNTSINKASRNKMLALIHLQKNKAKITDEQYIGILLDHAGVDSASKIENIKQFKSVIDALNKILIAQGKAPLGSSQNFTPQSQRFLNAVRAKANAVLGNHSKNRLQGYLNKMGKSCLEDCSMRELRRVMGFLRIIEKKY